jgi:hypothetical protein
LSCEVGDSPPSSVKVKNDGAIPALAHAYGRHSALLIKYRESLPFVSLKRKCAAIARINRLILFRELIAVFLRDK